MVIPPQSARADKQRSAIVTGYDDKATAENMASSMRKVGGRVDMRYNGKTKEWEVVSYLDDDPKIKKLR